MATCKVLRGFLTLRDCGNPSNTNCGSCGRPACSEHLSAGSGYTQCVDCFDRAGANPNAAAVDDEYGRDWVHGYRRSYYQSSGYRPIYSSIGHDPYYDDYDMRSFDPAMNSGTGLAALDNDDDERDPGFGDS